LFGGIIDVTMSIKDPPPVTTWDHFKRELKEQFYPKDAKREAKAKLRRLQHEEGHL